MIGRPARIAIVVVALLFLTLVLGRAAVELYTDGLWFASLGYLDVFWTRLGVNVGVQAVAAAVGMAIVLANLWIVGRRLGPVRVRRRYGNLEIAEQVPRRYVTGGMLLVAVLAGWWLAALQFGRGGALGVMAWLRSVPWERADPLFGHDLSFYVFALPVYFQITEFLLLAVLWTTALVVLGYVLVGSVRWRENRLEVDEKPRLHFILLVAALVLVLAGRYWLSRYGLVLEGNGIGGGIGYTDVEARLPAHRAMATLSLVVVAALLYGAWRRSWLPPVLSIGVLLLAAIGVGQIYPSMVQRFRVEPNEFVREQRYIRWNIDYTREAYGLNGLDRRAFPYEPREIPRWEDLEPSLAKLPLWDQSQLRTNWNARQTMYDYYHFPQVAYDRYPAAGGKAQVAIAVREFHPPGVPEPARTWQSLRMNPAYVRGLGVEVTPAADNSPQPLPWIGDLEPVRRHPGAPPDVNLEAQSVFIGQSMRDYVILVPGRMDALLGTPGRDFPEGIRLNSFPRILAFTWRFADVNLVFSGEITPESRFLFRRTVSERVRELAPFVVWDSEPYPVLHEGRIVWIQDGYTVSSSFPLARALQLEGTGRIRYMRNSVKATVDGVTGEVNLYVADEADPVLATHRRIFPELFQPIDAMPVRLRSHVRYPALLLRAQSSILSEYHLEAPQAFYAGQDFWEVPRISPNGAARPYVPSYALKRLPGETEPEFVLTVPFIARGRLNMTALLVARSDAPRYGELMLLEMPRDQQVPGPGHVTALIEQDAVIAPQFSLWRQAGSDVELGNLRVVPTDSALLYIKPVYLSARGTAIPQLSRVLVSDGREVVMATTLTEAFHGFRRVVADGVAPDEAMDAPVAEPIPVLPEMTDWPQRALDLLETADRRLREGDWAGFGEAWAELRELLSGMSRGVP